MASCKDCLHIDVCSIAAIMGENFCCPDCKDRNRFVELPCKVGEELYRIKTVSGKKIITETQLMCENCEKFNGINEHDYSECKDLICFRNWLGLAYLNWITEYE